MTLKSIKSKNDFENAIKRFDELFDSAEPNTPEGDEFVLLSEQIEDYELINVVLERKNQEEISVDLAEL